MWARITVSRPGPIPLLYLADTGAVRRTIHELAQWFRNVYGFRVVDVNSNGYQLTLEDSSSQDLAVIRQEVREITDRAGLNYTLVGEGGAACTP